MIKYKKTSLSKNYEYSDGSILLEPQVNIEKPQEKSFFKNSYQGTSLWNFKIRVEWKF